MINSLKWFEDTNSDIIPIGAKNFRVSDSYSQWILRHGADFDLSQELQKEDAKDFKFIIIYKKLANAGSINAASTNIQLFDFQSSNIAATQNNGSIDFIARLPLRKRSVLKGTRNCTPDELDFDDCNPARMVIVGVIDDAINIGHQRFRDSKGQSRVDYAWVQEADKLANSSVPFGCEWTRNDINAAIQTHRDDDVAMMDELELIGKLQGPYRSNPLLLHTSHGTHVADLAAGYSPEENKINRRLITVQLPSLATQDTSGAALIASVLEAARYVFERALIVSKRVMYPVPVVLNFSYAFNNGPRNGHHILERTLRKLAKSYKEETKKITCKSDKKPCGEAAPVELVLPAGNSHLARTHAHFMMSEFDGIGSLDLPLRLQPDDKTSSFLEIWYPKSTENIKLEIERPDGTLNAISLDTKVLNKSMVLAKPTLDDVNLPNVKTIVARVSLDTPNNTPQGVMRDASAHFRVLVVFAPTNIPDKGRLATQHGIWKVRVLGDLKASEKIQAWIQRDESVSGFARRGRQAYFDDSSYEAQRFDEMGDLAVFDDNCNVSGVRRNGTLSGIATNVLDDDTGQKFIVVGGYRWDNNAAAMYSSAGSDQIFGPLVMCSSDTSRVLNGILAAGTMSGTKAIQDGTSVTAPQVVRLLADQLENEYRDLNDRKDFDSHIILESLVNVPPRPTVDDPELAHTNIIRRERVEKGLLPIADDLKLNIVRGVETKVGE